MELEVIPEALVAASARVEAIVAELAAAQAAAMPFITAVVPPGADPVSISTAAAFSGMGIGHSVVASEGTEELGRAGVGVAESGAAYAATDLGAAATYIGG